jgi:hypothetical protein
MDGANLMRKLGTDRLQYRCAALAVLIWLVDALKVFVDQARTGAADWVPFLAFTGLLVLIAGPILLRKPRA